MSETDFPFAEYIKAATDMLVLMKTLYPLLPQGGDAVAAKIEAAERSLQMANVSLAKGWGYRIHDCTFPPQIMLWDPALKMRVCPNIIRAPLASMDRALVAPA